MIKIFLMIQFLKSFINYNIISLVIYLNPNSTFNFKNNYYILSFQHLSN
jgi:hypothetical protein